jgi:hypothetical protein
VTCFLGFNYITVRFKLAESFDRDKVGALIVSFLDRYFLTRIAFANITSTQWIERYREPDLPDMERKFIQQQLHPGLKASLAAGQGKIDETGSARLILQTEGRPNLRAVSLCTDKECKETDLPVLGRNMSIPVELPNAKSNIGDVVTAKFHCKSGKEGQIEWQ